MLIYLLHPLEKLKSKERLRATAAFTFFECSYGKRGKNEINSQVNSSGNRRIAGRINGV